MRLLSLCLIATLLPTGQHPADPVAARTKGSAKAPVVVYEMADFQCPACREFAVTTLPILDKAYVQSGKVRWVFVNFPLTNIHKNAVAAAQVAMCAARQNKFWPVHDALYLHQPEWAPLADPMPALLALADSSGVRRDSLTACVSSHATVEAIQQDAQGSVRAGANATPSFYIEGGLAAGAIPASEFSRILDSIYTAKTASR
ncbi:MAG: DsbA family protein [Acidobacteriota bacterium]